MIRPKTKLSKNLCESTALLSSQQVCDLPRAPFFFEFRLVYGHLKSRKGGNSLHCNAMRLRK